MKIDRVRRAIGLMGLVLPMSWAPASVAGQMRIAATAQAYGVSVSTPTANQTSPYAVLPTGGAMATDQGQSIDVAGLVTAQEVRFQRGEQRDAGRGEPAERTHLD